MVKNSRRLLGISRAAHSLDISPSTLRSWCYAGKLASHRIGGRRLIALTELERLIRESELPRTAVLASGAEASL